MPSAIAPIIWCCRRTKRRVFAPIAIPPAPAGRSEERVPFRGLRRKIGSRARILAVLEPRSNTMKLGTMKSQLPDSLREVDAAFCYAANLGWDAREALAPMGDRAVVEDDLSRLVDQIVIAAQPGDHILVMSNGGFGGIHGKILAALAA